MNTSTQDKSQSGVTANQSEPYLGLLVDVVERTVSRRGMFVSAHVSLSAKPKLWKLFLKMVENRERDLSASDFRKIGLQTLEAKRGAIKRLKDDLLPLGVTIPHSKKHLCDSYSSSK